MMAPIIVTAVFGDEDHAYLDGLRCEHFPPERNQLAAHLTMFHHLPPSAERELRTRLIQETRGRAQPKASLSGIINLSRGVAYRVASPELEAIRASLAEAFTGLLTPQDMAGWRPHVTIQNKAEVPAARALLQQMTASFVTRPLTIAGLSAFHYMGGPWQKIATYKFH